MLVFDTHLHPFHLWQWALQWMRRRFILKTFMSYYGFRLGMMWTFEAENREELCPQPASSTCQAPP